MKDIKLHADNLSKAFGMYDYIFSGVTLDLSNGAAIGITGNNGSGKTTLLKLLSNLTRPSQGKVEITIDNSVISKENFFRHIAYVAPYINIYEEFTPDEHINISANLSGCKTDTGRINGLFEEFRLSEKRYVPISTFSSGMKQRMKYILALQSGKEFLFLDEPFTNLDSEGIEVVDNIIQNHLSDNGCLIIASNDSRELKYTAGTINIMDYKQ